MARVWKSDKRALALAGGLSFVAALALRMVRIGAREAWLDEACTALFAGSADLDALLTTLRPESHPPLYYAFMMGWTRLFGASEIALRLPSALAGAGLVPLVWLAVRRWGGGRMAASLGAAVAAASPLLLYYSVEAKAYTLLWAAGLAVALLLHRATDEDASPGAAVGAGVLTCAALYLHHFAVFLLPLWPLAYLGAARRRRTAVAAAGLLAVAVWVPWAWGFLAEQTASGGTDWLAAWWSGPGDALTASARLMALAPPYPSYLGELGPVTLPSTAGIALGLFFGLPVLAGLAAAALGSAPVRARGLRALGRRALLPAALLAPTVGAALLSLWKPMYLPGRYELLAYPAWLVLWALGLDALLRRPGGRLRTALVAGAAVLATAAGLTAVSLPYLAQEPDAWHNRAAARLIVGDPAEGTAVVPVGLSLAPLQIKLDEESFPGAVEPFPPEMAAHPGWFEGGELDETALRQAARTLHETLREVDVVWLVTPLRGDGAAADSAVAAAAFAALRADGRVPGPPVVFGRLGLARFSR